MVNKKNLIVVFILIISILGIFPILPTYSLAQSEVDLREYVEDRSKQNEQQKKDTEGFTLKDYTDEINRTKAEHQQKYETGGGTFKPQTRTTTGSEDKEKQTASTGINPVENPDYWKPDSIDDSGFELFFSSSKNVLNIIGVTGIVVSVITLAILGFKYMLGSVQEKADYKKSMIPYLVGVILLMSGSTIVTIISNIALDIWK